MQVGQPVQFFDENSTDPEAAIIVQDTSILIAPDPLPIDWNGPVIKANLRLVNSDLDLQEDVLFWDGTGDHPQNACFKALDPDEDR